MRRRSRVLGGALVALLALVAGCQSGGTAGTTPSASSPTATNPSCGAPSAGQKYTLCGHVTTNGFANGAGVHLVVGTVDPNSPNTAASGYAVVAGGIHASN